MCGEGGGDQILQAGEVGRRRRGIPTSRFCGGPWKAAGGILATAGLWRSLQEDQQSAYRVSSWLRSHSPKLKCWGRLQEPWSCAVSARTWTLYTTPLRSPWSVTLVFVGGTSHSAGGRQRGLGLLS